MGNNIKSASNDREAPTRSLYEEEVSPSASSSTNYQDDLQSYKSYITQHQIIDQIQFRSLPDKFCSVRILIMQSGMNGNTLMYDTHHDNNFKQFKAKLNQNTKEVNERFRKMQMLKSTRAVNKIKTSSPSLKPLLGGLSQNNLNQSFQSQTNNTSSNNNINNKQSVGMNDTSILGEILFGSIPIQILGQNTKIHTLSQHKQTCLSKVFRVGLPVSTIIKTDVQSDHGDDSSSTSKDIPPNTEPNPNPVSTSPTPSPTVRNRAVSIIQQPNANQVSATAYSPNTLGTRNRSYSTSVTDAIRDNFTEKAAAASTTTEDTKQAHKKKDRKKKLHKDQDISFMCKSSFGIAVLLVFHDCGEDKDELQNPSQLQRLIFSHFPIFEHKLRKLLNSCKNSIQNYLKKKVDEARESDKLDEIFSGFTFNIKSFHGCLQDSEEISNASIDFNKFIISFLHAPRFNEPIWQSQSLLPLEKSNNFSTFLTDLALLTRKDEQHLSFFSLVLTTILSNHLSWVSQFIQSERSDCDDNPSLLIQKYLKSLYGSGYLPTLTSGEQDKKGLKKFCKIIVVGSNNKDIRYCISMITFLLQSTLLLEKEFSIDKPQQSSNLDSKFLPETLLTLTPMQFVEMKPPLKTKPRQKHSHDTTNPNIAIHTIESDSDEDSEYHIKPVVLVPKPNFTLAAYDNNVEEMNLKMKFNKFGNSLFADVCTWYCGGFVISGLPRYVNFQKELIEDLEFIQTESIDGDPRLPDVASCIIIDIEGRSCNVVTSKHKTAKFEEGHNSSIISKLLHELLFLRSVDQTSEGEKACEQIFKDTLYGLVLKTKLMFSIVDSIDSETNRIIPTNAVHWRSDSKQTPTKSLSEQLKKILVSKPKKNGSERITYEQLSHLLHVNISDIPLLMSIASAFRSDISKKVIPHKVSKKKKR
ncbi:predicted protein [Naegleria gruberi]|uniref:Predicted protein n=1 Tax=Naegleria gruberi TaxID=5762 RepID=D2VMF0_NAEGR|nr:uncharacterized protein NAEGRDRAFT_70110 [Naegleria gruberi]EFC41977.1 predicted protein [Naegleria gruberi]|eukprot:XP_002674721.1 predicted protein [Naegleria gruberi strain NEG-M]